jgi:3-(3-hydroxy-phenyl)propionate hydroxylase
MGKLNTDPGLAAPDDLYEALIAAHRDLDDFQSRKLDAKLILLLANHIGDAEVVREALALARADAPPATDKDTDDKGTDDKDTDAA